MWVKSENGGWSDTNQAMSWESILDWQVDMFFYSCYLYYVLDNPKLPDSEFDRIIDVLENHFDELSDRIKHVCGPGQIKETAHLFAHDLSDDEKRNALLWRNNEL